MKKGSDHITILTLATGAPDTLHCVIPPKPATCGYNGAHGRVAISKTYPGGKQVFAGISLHFLPDAKIGVVGVNGAGKSSTRATPGTSTARSRSRWTRCAARRAMRT
jgi:hypothetical protein